MAMGGRQEPAERGGGLAADAGPAGNVFDKYHTKNPIYRVMVRTFLTTVRSFARSLGGGPSILEVGCGEGHLARFLADGWEIPPIVAFDISLPVIREAARSGGGRFFVGDSHALPFADASFDLVVMCEVMEHLPRPEAALAEIARVARRACLVSVPREPLWRVLNMLRGAYWSDWGNTPGHVQWWSRRRFLALVSRFGKLRASASPYPWTVAFFEPNRR